MVVFPAGWEHWPLLSPGARTADQSADTRRCWDLPLSRNGAVLFPNSHPLQASCNWAPGYGSFNLQD